MPVASLIFKDVHLNALSALSLPEILLKPGELQGPFRFLGSSIDSNRFYVSLFSQQYASRTGKTIGPRTTPVRAPFVKGLGALQPLAGHEIRNQPPYKEWGGRITLLAPISVLPLKIRPNWTITIQPERIKKLKLSEVHCRLIAKVYPFGAASYQFRVRVKSTRGFDLDGLVEFLRSVTQEDALLVGKNRFSLAHLVMAVHSKIHTDIAGKETSIKTTNLPLIHRVVTLHETEPVFDPKTHSKELAAIVGLEPNWRIAPQANVEKYSGTALAARYENQFFTFHPESTILYPAQWPPPKRLDYARELLRDNFAAVLEFARVERILADDMIELLRALRTAPSLSFDQIQELRGTIPRVRERTRVLDLDGGNYWGKHLAGIHLALLTTAQKHPSWESSIGKLAIEMKGIEQTVFDLEETAAIRDVVSEIADANSTLDQLQAKAQPFGLDVELIKDLRNSGVRIQQDLALMAHKLEDIRRRAGTFNWVPTDDFAEITARRTVMDDVRSFNEDFLPKYQDYVENLVQSVQPPKPSESPPAQPAPVTPTSSPAQPSAPSPPAAPTAPPAKPSAPSPPAATGDLAKAQQLVGEALSAKSKMQKAYDSIVSFYRDAKPYITALIGAAKIALAFVPLL